jgi:hypothetical protein
MRFRLNKKNRTKIIIGAVALVVVIAGLWALDRREVINLPFLPDKNKDMVKDINYGPPTEEEKKETEEFKNKQNSGSPPLSTTSEPDQKKQVAPYVTSWGYSKVSGNAEISGYVPGVIESGGICTLTLKKGPSEVKETKSASPDAQNTSCGLISISRSQLSPGTWSAVLSYSSATAQGSSSSVTMEVE